MDMARALPSNQPSRRSLAWNQLDAYSCIYWLTLVCVTILAYRGFSYFANPKTGMRFDLASQRLLAPTVLSFPSPMKWPYIALDVQKWLPKIVRLSTEDLSLKLSNVQIQPDKAYLDVRVAESIQGPTRVRRIPYELSDKPVERELDVAITVAHYVEDRYCIASDGVTLFMIDMLDPTSRILRTDLSRRYFLLPIEQSLKLFQKNRIGLIDGRNGQTWLELFQLDPDLGLISIAEWPIATPGPFSNYSLSILEWDGQLITVNARKHGLERRSVLDGTILGTASLPEQVSLRGTPWRFMGRSLIIPGTERDIEVDGVTAKVVTSPFERACHRESIAGCRDVACIDPKNRNHCVIWDTEAAQARCELFVPYPFYSIGLHENRWIVTHAMIPAPILFYDRVTGRFLESKNPFAWETPFALACSFSFLVLAYGWRPARNRALRFIQWLILLVAALGTFHILRYSILGCYLEWYQEFEVTTCWMIVLHVLALTSGLVFMLCKGRLWFRLLPVLLVFICHTRMLRRSLQTHASDVEWQSMYSLAIVVIAGILSGTIVHFTRRRFHFGKDSPTIQRTTVRMNFSMFDVLGYCIVMALVFAMLQPYWPIRRISWNDGMTICFRPIVLGSLGGLLAMLPKSGSHRAIGQLLPWCSMAILVVCFLSRACFPSWNAFTKPILMNLILMGITSFVLSAGAWKVILLATSETKNEDAMSGEALQTKVG